MKVWLALWLWLVSIAACAANWQHASILQFEALKDEQRLRQESRLPDLEQRNRLLAVWREDANVPDNLDLHGLGESQLTFFLEMQSWFSFYEPTPEILADQKRLLDELERRGLATDEQRKKYYYRLLGAYRLDEASAYRQRHEVEGMGAVPLLLDAGGIGESDTVIYGVGKDGTSLLREGIDLHQGTRLIVVSHPLCAFSRAAMIYMESVPELKRIAHDNGIWLLPTSSNGLRLEVIASWNDEHPAMNMRFARDISDWPQLQFWDTPNFYLLMDGKVRDHFTGWPRDGANRHRLIEMLVRGDLLPPDRLLDNG